MRLRIYNTSDVEMRDLNLLAIFDEIAPGQGDKLSLAPTASADVEGQGPGLRFIHARFNAAVTALGLTPGAPGAEGVIAYEPMGNV